MRRMWLMVAMLLLGCAARPPRIWRAAEQRLPAGLSRVVYVDVGALERLGVVAHLAESVRTMRSVGKLAGCDLPLAGAELVLARHQDGHEAAFARFPHATPAAVQACLSAQGAGSAHAWLTSGVIAFSPRGDTAALDVMLGGRGALAGDVPFAEGLVSVDFGATIWAVLRPPPDAKLKGTMTMNARLSAAGVLAWVVIPVGSRYMAVAMARLMQRELAKDADLGKGVTVDSEADRVIVRLFFDVNAMHETLDQFGLD
jgi:hypothetical protein